VRYAWILATLALLASCSSQNTAIPPVASEAHSAPIGAGGSVWSVISSPNGPGSRNLTDDMLVAVSGTAADDVWAVGWNCCKDHKYYEPLILHYDGSKWSLVPAAQGTPLGTRLHGVAAIAADDAWAVGGTSSQPVFEHWNGKQWSVVGSPYLGYGGVMNAIYAFSSNDVWAAGEGDYEAVLEHWNGTTWTFVPGYSYNLTFVNALSGSGTSDLWAVGESWEYPDQRAFAEHWNGTGWTYEKTPYLYIDQLNGVADISPTNAWAVGFQYPSQQELVVQTLIEHWNGTAWSVVPSPNKNPKTFPLTNALTSVTAISANDVWAVGYWTWYAGAGTSRSLFLHYDGKAWTVKPGPSALESDDNSKYNSLEAMTRLPSRQLWAVGNKAMPPHCCAHTLTVEAMPR
jgi:hypothetical protein